MSGKARSVSAMNGKASAETGTNEVLERLVYRLPEAGQLLGGICRKTVRALVLAGELETTQIGAYDMVTRESIEAYIKRGKERAKERAAAKAA